MDWAHLTIGPKQIKNKFFTCSFGSPSARVIRLDGIQFHDMLSIFDFPNKLKIYITHIGGYPGNYNKRVKKVIEETRPNVFICGHSHILKVIYDKKNDLLHMNPGACGLQGFHKKRTMLKFNIENKKITNLNVIELGGK